MGQYMLEVCAVAKLPRSWPSVASMPSGVSFITPSRALEMLGFPTITVLSEVVGNRRAMVEGDIVKPVCQLGLSTPLACKIS